MPLNATIEAVTKRIRRRSADERARYLERVEAALYLGVCDKIVPGMLIGALSFGHLPDRGRVRSN